MTSTQQPRPVRRPLSIATLRSYEYERFLKFLAVGGVGFILNAAIYWILPHSFRWNPSLANLFGAAVAIFSNFNLNNIWTFQGKRITGLAGYLWKLLHFYAASAFGVIVIQTGVIFLGTSLIGAGTLRLLGFGISYHWVYFLAGTSLLVIWNFFAYNKFIWNRAALATE